MLPTAPVVHGNEVQADAAPADDCPSDSLKHSNPTNMAQPPDPDISHLEAMPNELLMTIFEQLVDDNDRWPRRVKLLHRGTFRSLCLVSKRIDLIARPFLFKKIFVFDLGTLVKLYRTVTQTPSLVEQIEEIDLSVHYICRRFGFWSSERILEFNECCQLIGDRGLKASRGPAAYEDGPEGIMCYELLARTVNLSSLKINTEAGDTQKDSDERHDGNPYGDESHLEFFDRVSRATRPAVGGGSAIFLPRLKTLALRNSGGSISIRAFEPFLNLPSLKTVRGLRDNGNWWILAPGGERHELLPYFHGERWARPNITTLELSQTETCQYDMEDIAQLFPCLKCLSFHRYHLGFHRMKNHVAGGSPRALSTSLGKMTALRTLKIDVRPELNVDTGLNNNITAPLDSGNVFSLAQLPNLEQLEVSLCLFGHAGGPALGGTMAIPREVLPQTLKTLVLLTNCDWELCGGIGKDGPCWGSMAAALQFLESLGDDLPCFPHLESLAYRFERSSCGDPFWSDLMRSRGDEAAEDSLCSRLQVISASYLKQNVQFLLQEKFYEGWGAIDLKELANGQN